MQTLLLASGPCFLWEEEAVLPARDVACGTALNRTLIATWAPVLVVEVKGRPSIFEHLDGAKLLGALGEAPDAGTKVCIVTVLGT